MTGAFPPPEGGVDTDAISAKWLRQCGPCDAGLAMKCSHPDEDYRPVMLDLVREVERLRTLLDQQARREGGAVSEVDIAATDRLIWEVARAFRKHPDSWVVTGAGGQRPLFGPETESLARIALRVVGCHLADVAEPPAEDSMATDEDLLKYDGRHEAASKIRLLTEGAWER